MNLRLLSLLNSGSGSPELSFRTSQIHTWRCAIATTAREPTTSIEKAFAGSRLMMAGELDVRGSKTRKVLSHPAVRRASLKALSA
jgi:hypothetical protein